MRRTRDDLAGATAVLYARRSKHDPANPGKSTADQIDTQRVRAAKLGLQVVAEFTDDGIGASRYSTKKVRPGFVNAVEHLRSHPVDVFAVWELSRATRRLTVYSDLIELCEDRGTYLLVGDRIYDPLDSTDQMVLSMTAVQDSVEVARIRQRTLRGVESIAAAGRPHGRNIYGYKRVYDPDTRQLLTVMPHPEQAPVIMEMVARTIAGVPANEIIRDLNSRGLRKPTGALWHPSDVREMLTRPTYRGMRGHKGVEIDGIWPALISPDDWLRLQRIFAQRSRGVHDTTAKHLLTGVVLCCRCDRPMYVDVKRGRYTQTYYHCHRCSRSRNAKHLEAEVRAVVNAALREPGPRSALIGAKDPDRDHDRAELAALQAELEEAYLLGLSPRGLLTTEQRLLPLIEQAQQRLTSVDDRSDLADVLVLPEDVREARLLLRRLVRVWVGASRRGRGFDPASVQILPLGDRPLNDGL